jgi:uncharacterized SAM-binding protein YcdF (DUF218 family)
MKRWLSLLGLLLLGICCLAAVAIFFRVPIFRGMAEAWIVNEPLVKADAIVVLGGGLVNRPFAAAKLYHDGFAPKVLYMDVKLNATEELGVYPSEKELTRRMLLSNNIPETALVSIGHNVASTYDESLAVRAWIEKNGAKSIIIPTDPFHTRRVRWLFQKRLAPLHTQVMVETAPTRDYSETNWWQSEQGVIAFQNEVAKFVYYRVRY